MCIIRFYQRTMLPVWMNHPSYIDYTNEAQPLNFRNDCLYASDPYIGLGSILFSESSKTSLVFLVGSSRLGSLIGKEYSREGSSSLVASGGDLTP